MLNRRSSRGQILPIFVLALVAILAMVALVIEGGNLFAQQRISQNASDAAANAGAIAIGENLLEPGIRNGDDVINAITAAAAQTTGSSGDDLDSFVAIYTNGFGDAITPVTTGAIPADARGVNVAGTREVQTTIARTIGINQIPVSADATAVAGVRSGPCPPDTSCVVLPVTMPVSFGDTICDQDLNSLGINNPASAWAIIDDPADANAGNESVLPLCGTASGDFGWLDLGPDNLQREILNPSGQDFLIPDWIQTQPGNPNSAEGEINFYEGRIVQIPMWQDICGEDPGGPLDPCTDPGANGNNTWYNIPYMRSFLLDTAFIQGDNRNDCSVPGYTWPSETTVPGLIGCLKGWWLSATATGGPIDPNLDIDPANDPVIGIVLIK